MSSAMPIATGHDHQVSELKLRVFEAQVAPDFLSRAEVFGRTKLRGKLKPGPETKLREAAEAAKSKCSWVKRLPAKDAGGMLVEPRQLPVAFGEHTAVKVAALKTARDASIGRARGTPAVIAADGTVTTPAAPGVKDHWYEDPFDITFEDVECKLYLENTLFYASRHLPTDDDRAECLKFLVGAFAYCLADERDDYSTDLGHDLKRRRVDLVAVIETRACEKVLVRAPRPAVRVERAPAGPRVARVAGRLRRPGRERRAVLQEHHLPQDRAQRGRLHQEPRREEAGRLHLDGRQVRHHPEQLVRDPLPRPAPREGSAASPRDRPSLARARFRRHAPRP